MSRGRFGTATDLLCHILRPDPAAGAVSQHDSTDHGYQQNEPSCFEKKNVPGRSEEHTSELQSLMRISYAVFCLKKKIYNKRRQDNQHLLDTIIHTIITHYTTYTLEI